MILSPNARASGLQMANTTLELGVLFLLNDLKFIYLCQKSYIVTRPMIVSPGFVTVADDDFRILGRT